MKITKISSSTIIIENDDVKLLCDPWVENGEYYGAWSLDQQIDISDAYKRMNSCDAIYISHIHPDHLSPKTMKKLDLKDKKIYIHSYASNFLKKNLERMGYNNVLPIDHGTKKNIFGKTFLSIYAADNCDPSMCLKFYGCNYETEDISKNSHQIDSCMVLQDEKYCVVNLNDCIYPMMTKTIENIKNDFKKIDVLLVNYNSAHSFPQCILNFDINKKKELSLDIKKSTFDKSINFINDFNPDFFIPMAGEYLLSGKNFFMNDFMGVNSQAECQNFFSNSKFQDKFIMLNYGENFNILDKKRNKFKIQESDKFKEYKDSISRIKYDYEMLDYPKLNEIENSALNAFQRLYNRINLYNEKFEETVYIKFFDKFIKLDLKKLDISFVNDFNKSTNNYVIIETDPRLLYEILKGPRYAHWNNADIGSHLMYYRSDPQKYNYRLGNTLVYFHN